MARITSFMFNDEIEALKECLAENTFFEIVIKEIEQPDDDSSGAYVTLSYKNARQLFRAAIHTGKSTVRNERLKEINR